MLTMMLTTLTMTTAHMTNPMSRLGL